MTKHTYILKNHNIADKNTIIKATIELNNFQLKLNYQIIGDLSKYSFQKQNRQQRADKLWLNTCFELFISNRDHKEYWEINISPTTEWNIYHFTRYKESMRESHIFSTPKISTNSDASKYELSVETTVQKEILKKELEINLCVIILDKDEKRNFYSINRQNGSPNFHNRLVWSKILNTEVL